MTDQQSGPGADYPVADLQPLPFQLKDDNGTAAIFQARIDNGDAVYTLTVTTVSPGNDQQQKKQLDAFLAAMRAKFTLITLNSGVDPVGDQQPEPFDVNLGTLIVPDLVMVRTGTGPFGVMMTVLTAVEPELTQTEEGLAQPRGDLVGHVSPQHDHYYTARDGVDSAAVWAVGGSGTVRTAQPSVPPLPITVGGATQTLGPAKRLIVHGTGLRRCTYYVDGRFK